MIYLNSYKNQKKKMDNHKVYSFNLFFIYIQKESNKRRKKNIEKKILNTYLTPIVKQRFHFIHIDSLLWLCWGCGLNRRARDG